MDVASTGVDVAITRTFFATTLILTTLSGHPEVMVPCLCASLVSLFVTLDFPFIGPQRSRRRACRSLSKTYMLRASSLRTALPVSSLPHTLRMPDKS